MFLASQDTQEVMLVTQSALADFTDASLPLKQAEGGELLPTHPSTPKDDVNENGNDGKHLERKVNMINCTISGTVHIFFLKKSYLSPRCPKLQKKIFLVQFFHNIYLSNGLGVTIGTPSWPKLKKCVKKVLFCLSQICKYFGYPPLGGAFVSKFWP